MAFKSKAQARYMNEHEGQGSLTPAVVKEFDQATKGKYAELPEHVSEGPGATHHGQLASHHAMMGAHYRGLASEPGPLQPHHAAIAEHHRGLGVAHAALAEAMPPEESPVATRLKKSMKARGIPMTVPTAEPTQGPPAPGSGQ